MGEIFVSKYTTKEIQAMLKLIPNGVGVTLEDLEEIYSQDDKKTSNSKSSH